MASANIVLDGTAVTANIVTPDDPAPDAGMEEGYTDERREIGLAVLVADFPGPPLGGMVVTFEDRPGEFYAVDAGSVSKGSGGDWRFTVTEADDDGA